MRKPKRTGTGTGTPRIGVGGWRGAASPGGTGVGGDLPGGPGILPTASAARDQEERPAGGGRGEEPVDVGRGRPGAGRHGCF